MSDAGPDDLDVSLEDAVAMLPGGDGKIHTRQQMGALLLGFEWPREAFIEMMKNAKWIRRTGPNAQAEGYRMSMCEGGRILFVDTDEKWRPRYEARLKEQRDNRE